jgi:hypothetical protein
VPITSQPHKYKSRASISVLSAVSLLRGLINTTLLPSNFILGDGKAPSCCTVTTDRLHSLQVNSWTLAFVVRTAVRLLLLFGESHASPVAIWEEAELPDTVHTGWVCCKIMLSAVPLNCAVTATWNEREIEVWLRRRRMHYFQNYQLRWDLKSLFTYFRGFILIDRALFWHSFLHRWRQHRSWYVVQ